MRERKRLRLENWDYSAQGVYFLTINVNHRAPIFGHVEYDGVVYTQRGQCAIAHIEKIPQVYQGVFLDTYMVMPDHVHLLLRIEAVRGASHAPPLEPPDKRIIPKVIQGTKAAITKTIRGVEERSAYDALLTKNLWHPSYYDHIVRNQQEYQEIFEYIQTNPLRWTLRHPAP